MISISTELISESYGYCIRKLRNIEAIYDIFYPEAMISSIRKLWYHLSGSYGILYPGAMVSYIRKLWYLISRSYGILCPEAIASYVRKLWYIVSRSYLWYLLSGSYGFLHLFMRAGCPDVLISCGS